MATAVSIVADVIVKITAYIRRCGGSYPQWYVGVASDPPERLFHDHNVQEHGDQWIYVPCTTDGAARQVEAHFLGLGCQGGPGGGDQTSRYVYAYKIRSHTTE